MISSELETRKGATWRCLINHSFPVNVSIKCRSFFRGTVHFRIACADLKNLSAEMRGGKIPLSTQEILNSGHSHPRGTSLCVPSALKLQPNPNNIPI